MKTKIKNGRGVILLGNSKLSLEVSELLKNKQISFSKRDDLEFPHKSHILWVIMFAESQQNINKVFKFCNEYDINLIIMKANVRRNAKLKKGLKVHILNPYSKNTQELVSLMEEK